jgi:acetaldehyde dehydrogenase (acetylating)
VLIPSNRVLVNTPAPQFSTGITTNVFPSMTLGCGAVAGNITSDNIGPQHLMNIKRLAYTVRKPEEAFEMPLDYNAAPSGDALAGGGDMDRAAVVSAVERFLLSKGIAASASTQAAASGLTQAPAQVTESLWDRPPGLSSIIADVTADVVNRFLAQRGGGSNKSPGGYG